MLQLPLRSLSIGVGSGVVPQRDSQPYRVQDLYRVHAGDSWTVGSRLTINAGLAWSYEPNAINDDLTKDITEARGGAGGGRGRGANPETLTKIQGLRKEALTKVTKVLTDDQKKTYDDLTGKPFEYKPDAPAGRGRGNNPDKPRTDF